MKLSVIKTIKNDMLVLFSLIGCVVFSLFGITFVLFGISFTKMKGIIILVDENQLLFGLIFIVTSIILLVLMIIRIKKINNFFINSKITKGKVTKIEYFKDRGYFHYEYKILGIAYNGMVFIHKTKDTTKYIVNDDVTILVNPEKVNKSIIKEFYL